MSRLLPSTHLTYSPLLLPFSPHFRPSPTPLPSPPQLTDPSTGSRVLVRDDHLMRISYPSGEQLLLAPDGTRLSRMAGGAWAVEFEGGSGTLPSVFGNTTSGELHLSPCPGVELVSAGGVVTCKLPDGSSVLVGGPVGAFVPSGMLEPLNGLRHGLPLPYLPHVLPISPSG